jgi:hypothetical protein
MKTARNSLLLYPKKTLPAGSGRDHPKDSQKKSGEATGDRTIGISIGAAKNEGGPKPALVRNRIDEASEQ